MFHDDNKGALQGASDGSPSVSLGRTNQLLASLVQAEGTAKLPENTDSIPFGTITVPDGQQYYGIPKGKTTFNFADGHVKHHTVGRLASIPTIRNLSREFDASFQQLRALYIYADAPCQIQFDGGNTRTIEAGQHYHFSDARFTEVQVSSDYPVDVTMAASTRQTSQSVASSGAHSERKGSRSGGAYDSWESIVLAPPELWDNDDITVTDGGTATHKWYVRPFETNTIQVVNGSSSANDIDVRVQARDTRTQGGTNADDWYTIGDVSNLSQNARHKFVVDEPHHMLRVQFQNSTNGNTVAAGCTTVGVN